MPGRPASSARVTPACGARRRRTGTGSAGVRRAAAPRVTAARAGQSQASDDAPSASRAGRVIAMDMTRAPLLGGLHQVRCTPPRRPFHSASSAAAFGLRRHLRRCASRRLEQLLLGGFRDDDEALFVDALRLAGGVVMLAALDQPLAHGAHGVVALGARAARRRRPAPRWRRARRPRRWPRSLACARDRAAPRRARGRRRIDRTRFVSVLFSASMPSASVLYVATISAGVAGCELPCAAAGATSALSIMEASPRRCTVRRADVMCSSPCYEAARFAAGSREAD